MRQVKHTNELTMTAMMMCIIMLATTLFRLPVPGTSGYVHMGDAVIFLSVSILGWRKGSMAAALGSAMADLLSGFAIWMPWSFVIKGVMAIILGLWLEHAETAAFGTAHPNPATIYDGVGMPALYRDIDSAELQRTAQDPQFKAFKRLTARIVGMLLAGVFMTAAYLVAERIMYGSWAVAALGIPWNIAQFTVGLLVALALEQALKKTKVRAL